MGIAENADICRLQPVIGPPNIISIETWSLKEGSIISQEVLFNRPREAERCQSKFCMCCSPVPYPQSRLTAQGTDPLSLKKGLFRENSKALPSDQLEKPEGNRKCHSPPPRFTQTLTCHGSTRPTRRLSLAHAVTWGD